MAAIRRYITPPKWWSQQHMEDTVPVYIRAIEQMCLDAGLVKSTNADNMDTSNIVLPTWPMTGVANSYNNTCSKKLSFDFADPMQVQLPIRIEFTFGYYCYSKNTTPHENYYPYFNYTGVKVGIVGPDNNIRIGREFNSSYKYGYSSVLSDAFYKTLPDYRPYTEFGGMDSFVSVSDGFVAMSILPEFAESHNTTMYYSTEVLFTVERSFDNTNTPTGRNINLVCVTNSDITTSARLYTFVMSKDKSVFSTLDTMYYYNTPHNYNMGNLILYPFLHFNEDYTVQQSSNYCGVKDAVLSVGVEAAVSINDMPPVNFIKTSTRDATNYPSASTLCGLMVKFE